jgi:hypothetical protein
MEDKSINSRQAWLNKYVPNRQGIGNLTLGLMGLIACGFLSAYGEEDKLLHMRSKKKYEDYLFRQVELRLDTNNDHILQPAELSDLLESLGCSYRQIYTTYTDIRLALVDSSYSYSNVTCFSYKERSLFVSETTLYVHIGVCDMEQYLRESR